MNYLPRILSWMYSALKLSIRRVPQLKNINNDIYKQINNPFPQNASRKLKY